MSEDKVWYVGINDQREGPFTREEIGSMGKESRVTRETLVWKKGMQDWMPITDVGDLSRIPFTESADRVGSGSSRTTAPTISKNTQSLTIALVCGILSIPFSIFAVGLIPGLIGCILGRKWLRKQEEISPGQKIMARIAFSTGAIGAILGFLFFFVILFGLLIGPKADEVFEKSFGDSPDYGEIYKENFKRRMREHTSKDGSSKSSRDGNKLLEDMTDAEFSQFLNSQQVTDPAAELEFNQMLLDDALDDLEEATERLQRAK